jgi:hypothetical protein
MRRVPPHDDRMGPGQRPAISHRSAAPGSGAGATVLQLQRLAGNAATSSLLHHPAPTVQRSIEWARSWNQYLWNDQPKKGQLPQEQRPADPKAQMRAAVLAAAKANPDNKALVEAVADEADFDVDEIDRLAVVKAGKGLLQFPVEGALENAAYFAAEKRRRAAKGNGYVSILSGIHTSYSYAKPHMTIDVYDRTGKSTRYHLEVAWDGAWTYVKLERT